MREDRQFPQTAAAIHDAGQREESSDREHGNERAGVLDAPGDPESRCERSDWINGRKISADFGALHAYDREGSQRQYADRAEQAIAPDDCETYGKPYSSRMKGARNPAF